MFDSRIGHMVTALLCIVMFMPCFASSRPVSKTIEFPQEIDEGYAPRWGKDDPINIRLQVGQLFQQGFSLYQEGHFADALPVAQRALSIVRNGLRPDHPVVATATNDLAMVYEALGRYAEAEELLKQALAIRIKEFGPDHPDVASALNNLALVYQAKGRYAAAEPLYKRSLAIREKAFGRDYPVVAVSLNSLAGLYVIQGRYPDAEPLYKQSLVIFEKAFGPDDRYVATALSGLATLYLNKGLYSDAEPLDKRLLATVEKTFGPDNPAVAVPMNNLAELYRAEGRYAEAESLDKRSLAIRERALGPNHPDVAVSLNNLAVIYQAQGRYTDAELAYKRSLAITEKLLAEKAVGPDHPEIGIALNNLALVYELQGRYADAERFYKQAWAIAQKLIAEKAIAPDHPAIAALLNNLAEFYQSVQGRYAAAERLYEQSLAIQRKALGSDHPYVAASLDSLARLYVTQGRYADAEPLYQQSLAILDKAFGPGNLNSAAVLNNLADLYRVRGRYADATPLYKQSLAIRQKALGPNHPDVAASLNNEALVYEAQGRYADAESLLKESLAIRQRVFGVEHPYVAVSRSNLASVYVAQGRYADAEPLYNRSLAIAQKLIAEKAIGPDNPVIATLLKNMAVLYAKQGRLADAEEPLKQSLAIREKAFGPDHPAVAESLNLLAALYKAQGRYSDALPIVKRTITHNFPNKSIAFSVLHGANSAKLIPPKEALDASYTVLQRSVSSAAGMAVSQLAVRFAAGTDDLAQLVRKDQDLTAEVGDLDKKIVEAVSNPTNQRNPVIEQQMRERIDELKSKQERLQKVLSQRYPNYSALSRPQPLTIEQTQALLDDDEALIAIDLDQKSGYAWAITKDRAEWRPLSVRAQDVSKEVATLRNGLDPNAPNFDRDLAYHLYQQLLKPIEGIITQKRRLAFVLDGALTSLPPQVLIAADPGNNKNLASLDWLVRKYAVTVLPSVESLQALRGQHSVVEAAEPMIGYGDPVFNRTVQRTTCPKVSDRGLPSFYRGSIIDTTALGRALCPLPKTANELREVGRLLGAKPGDIKLGEDTTVADVMHERLSDYRVVYFATHALVAGDIERFTRAKAEPALVLSIPTKSSEEDNGLLTASEVATLKLNADFVVLSGCNTAAGDKPGAEALSGLARAFFYAGARSLVVSYWDVDDEATVTLMDGLFSTLKANPGLSHAEALRLSMLQMIDHPTEPEFTRPAFWAPFVIVGEPKK